MNKPLLLTCFLLYILLTLNSCSRDELGESTTVCTDDISYNSVIKEIIDTSCSYTGCHDGGAGIGPGDYTRYGGAMLRDLNNGLFRSRTVDQRDNQVLGMPPDNSAFPESLKDDLTSEELNYIICWLDSGFPEN